MFGATVSTPYQNSNAAPFGFILLLTTDAEPGYTDQTDQFEQPSEFGESMDTNQTAGASKRFYYDDVEDHLVRSLQSVDGREGIEFRSRFLYLPFQADSGNPIRSVGVYLRVSPEVTLTSAQTGGRIARTRLKDSGGTPITITKSASQVLLVEWKFTLLNV